MSCVWDKCASEHRFGRAQVWQGIQNWSRQSGIDEDGGWVLATPA